MSRTLGLDLGTRRIGVAVSDPTGTVATPLLTFPHRTLRQDLARISELCAAHEVARIVIGWPRNMDGSRGPAARMAEEFAELLRRAQRLPVDLWDERLSSEAAERALVEAGLRRKTRRSARDRVAAALMLQAYLSARSRALPEQSATITVEPP